MGVFEYKVDKFFLILKCRYNSDFTELLQSVTTNLLPQLNEGNMVLTSMTMDYKVGSKLATLMMFIMGLLISSWSVTMATDGAGCGDPESFLRYRKVIFMDGFCIVDCYD